MPTNMLHKIWWTFPYLMMMTTMNKNKRWIRVKYNKKTVLVFPDVKWWSHPISNTKKTTYAAVQSRSCLFCCCSACFSHQPSINPHIWMILYFLFLCVRFIAMFSCRFINNNNKKIGKNVFFFHDFLLFFLNGTQKWRRLLLCHAVHRNKCSCNTRCSRSWNLSAFTNLFSEKEISRTLAKDGVN